MAELRLTIIIPTHNAEDTIQSCINSLANAKRLPDETIVVDDNSTDGSALIAHGHHTRIIYLEGGSRGPAYARNRGAEAATGDVLVFIDSDVTVHSDTLLLIEKAFLEHLDVDALFGSYDDHPPRQGLVNQYKNLMHHYVHQHGEKEAFTFWAGCGAVRRDVYIKSGGFDEVYTRPSIEDIELGYRLRRAGYRIRLCPEIQVTHLKKWTLASLIYTDIFCRAIPWTRLILQDGKIPSDLNLDNKSKLSALLVLFTLCCFLLGFLIPLIRWGLPVSIAFLIGLNKSIYYFFKGKHGIPFMLGAVLMHWLYLFYSSLVFVLVGGPLWIRRKFSLLRQKD